MNAFGVIFLLFSGALMLSPFVLMVTKSYYHFEYLKKINPEKFKKYSNYFDTYNNFEFFNKYRVVLIFPFFKRNPEAEETEGLSQLVKRIKFFCRLTYFSLAVLVVYVTILIVFFGDFS